ncbi:unnamed protein product [Onchocerca ochengi]|uniref:Mediator of RNA polymerase II transcription subunit 22 n=1 Tax=Onchocerca ochengi TaxID=42157 RepID=A0A182EPU1_ONCOC|nr:unnamed protein product [Onchocerca ochengi]
MNNNGQHLSSNLSRSRIDSSTPKSFYCSPKSYHYIPFAQRRSQLANFGRQTSVKNCQNRLWSQLSEQRGSCLFTKRDTSNKDSPMSSTSFKATFPNTSRTNRSVQSRNNQLQVPNQQQSKEFISVENSNLSQSKIQSQTSSCVYGNYDEEMREKLDQFKSEILDHIIQRGVYTDRITNDNSLHQNTESIIRKMANAQAYFSVIQDCISRSVAENSTLTMASLQQAITELLTDIGVISIKVNKKAWKANSDFLEPADEVLNYENEEFESDEGESLSAIPSVESCSDKLAEEDKSPASNFGSLSITDSLTTLSNSSVTDTSN